MSNAVAALIVFGVMLALFALCFIGRWAYFEWGTASDGMQPAGCAATWTAADPATAQIRTKSLSAAASSGERL